MGAPDESCMAFYDLDSSSIVSLLSYSTGQAARNPPRFKERGTQTPPLDGRASTNLQPFIKAPHTVWATQNGSAG